MEDYAYSAFALIQERSDVCIVLSIYVTHNYDYLLLPF